MSENQPYPTDEEIAENWRVWHHNRKLELKVYCYRVRQLRAVYQGDGRAYVLLAYLIDRQYRQMIP